MRILTNTQQPTKEFLEQRWVLVFALIVMTLTSIPYILGFLTQGEEWRFTGFVFGVEDGNSYIGKMLRGAQGDWLFRTPYTAKYQVGAILFIPYLLLGKLSVPANQHTQLVFYYHVFRFIGGILSILATYDFVSLFIKDIQTRRLSVVFATLGGGLGWFLVLIGKTEWMGSLPIDFYSPETFGFLGIYGIAHLPWARAFFLWGLRFYLPQRKQLKDNSVKIFTKTGIQTGILWLITGITNPITGVVIGVVAGFHVILLLVLQIPNLVRTKSVDWELVNRYGVSAISAGLVAFPMVLYYTIVFLTDPFLKIWVSQNQIPSPHFLHYLAAYGLILPFVFIGIKSMVKEPSEYNYLLLSWMILASLFLLIPFSLQRRLVEGLWVALVISAFVAYEKIHNQKFRRSFWIFLLTLPTTVFLIIGGVFSVNNPQEPVFHPIDEVVVFEFLANESNSHAVVLCAYETGNVLPAWAPVFVVIGHGPESAGIKENAPRVEAFYQEQTSDNERMELLNEFDVDYVFWGPAERRYGDWEPSGVDYLALTYQQGDYQIYKVINSN